MTPALLGEQETTELAMKTLWLWCKRYGVPKALYTDRKNVQTNAVDQLGRTTSFYYNTNKQITRITDVAGTIQYDYDANQNRTRMIRPEKSILLLFLR